MLAVILVIVVGTIRLVGSIGTTHSFGCHFGTVGGTVSVVSAF